MSTEGASSLSRQGKLHYRACPFSDDDTHLNYVRKAYNAALPYLLDWCYDLAMEHGWTQTIFRQSGPFAAFVSCSTGSIWPDTFIALPSTADQFFCPTVEPFFRDMFSKFEVVCQADEEWRCYGTEKASLGRYTDNCPEPVHNIILLLQCVLPGQLAYTTYRPDGSVNHVNLYPTYRWCLHHLTEVLDVTMAWQGLSTENEDDKRDAAWLITNYCKSHHFIKVHGRYLDHELIPQWHPVPFRWSSNPWHYSSQSMKAEPAGQPAAPTSLAEEALVEEALAGDSEPMTPVTPAATLFSSPGFSPNLTSGSSSPPTPPPSTPTCEDWIVSIPPSPAASYYDPYNLPSESELFEALEALDIEYSDDEVPAMPSSLASPPTPAASATWSLHEAEEPDLPQWIPSQQWVLDMQEGRFRPSTKWLQRQARQFTPSERWQAWHALQMKLKKRRSTLPNPTYHQRNGKRWKVRKFGAKWKLNGPRVLFPERKRSTKPLLDRIAPAPNPSFPEEVL